MRNFSWTSSSFSWLRTASPLLLGCAFLLINYLFTVRYEENDDVLMLLIASGEYSGSPDNHLIFINFLYGSVLNWLYRLAPQVEWYTVIFVMLNIAATSLLIDSSLKVAKSKRAKVTLIAFIATMFIYISVSLQFTYTAAVLAIAGLSQIYASERKALGMAAFVVGSLVRFDAIILILIISLPLFIRNSWSVFAYHRDKRVVALSVAFLIAGVCKVADWSYYHFDSEWHYFHSFNQIRGQINDNPNSSRILSTLPSDITPTDYELLLYGLANPEAVDIKDLQILQQLLADISYTTKLQNVQNLSTFGGYLALLLLLTGIAMLLSKANRYRILAVAGIFLLLMIYISLDSTPKDRVFFSGLFAAVISIAYLVVNWRRTAGYSLMLCLATLAVPILYITYRTQSRSARHTVRYTQRMELINDYLQTGNTLVPYGISYRLEYGNPFQISDNFLAQQNYIGGWLTHSPLNKDKFDTFSHFINNYGFVVNTERYPKAADLVAHSIFLNNRTFVTPIVVGRQDKIAIIEFQTPDSMNTVLLE